jgi:hypothetical protein
MELAGMHPLGVARIAQGKGREGRAGYFSYYYK